MTKSTQRNTTDNPIENEALMVAMAEKLVDMIESRLAGPTERLWKSEDCADYLRVSNRHFVDRVSKHPSFPPPFTLPGSGTGPKGAKRWFRDDVIVWAFGKDDEERLSIELKEAHRRRRQNLAAMRNSEERRKARTTGRQSANR